MTTYVFFIGGTGARVLRSLVMLLASGVEIGANNKIVPVIIDYDMQNGDLKEAKDLLNLYNRLHNTAAYTSGESGFFNAAIEMRDYSMANIKGDGDRDTFAKYIMYSFLKNDRELAPTAALINALYDDSPQDSPSTELNLEMSVGFKGNPNIGSVIFNDYFNDRSYGYQDFVSEFGDGSRAFIVGSIFGGTGSSGLPQLVKKFRQEGEAGSGNSTALQHAPVGACVVLPYFNVNKDARSAISSDTFNSKAKAALTYYAAEINSKLNEIYYIGCSGAGQPYANHEGGEAQKNYAHLVEVLSAMSIIEFIRRDDRDIPNKDLTGTPECYEYRVQHGLLNKNGRDELKPVSYLDILGLKNDDEKSIYHRYVRHLNAFAYFVKYCLDFTFSGKDSGMFGQSYYKSLGKYITGGQFGPELKDFEERFVRWTKELGDNSQLRFDPYDFSQELDYLVHRDENKAKAKDIKDTIRLALANGSKEYKSEPDSAGKIFLHIGSQAGIEAADR